MDTSLWSLFITVSALSVNKFEAKPHVVKLLETLAGIVFARISLQDTGRGAWGLDEVHDVLPDF